MSPAYVVRDAAGAIVYSGDDAEEAARAQGDPSQPSPVAADGHRYRSDPGRYGSGPQWGSRTETELSGPALEHVLRVLGAVRAKEDNERRK